MTASAHRSLFEAARSSDRCAAPRAVMAMPSCADRASIIELRVSRRHKASLCPVPFLFISRDQSRARLLMIR